MVVTATKSRNQYATTILAGITLEDCKPEIQEDIHWHFPCGLVLSDEFVGFIGPVGGYIELFRKAHSSHHEREHSEMEWGFIEEVAFEEQLGCEEHPPLVKQKMILTIWCTCDAS